MSLGNCKLKQSAIHCAPASVIKLHITDSAESGRGIEMTRTLEPFWC